jgi:glycerophosphoryl diester phosphodiesterase
MLIRHLLAWTAAACAPVSAGASALQCGPDPEAFQAMRARVLHPSAGQVVVVAHRGCFAAAPENTPLAIEHCARIGVEVVENDVRMSADGELFVLHDATIDRVTNGSGKVGKLTSRELATLKMRTGAGGPQSAVSDQPVPTLRAYFRAARNRVMINLEFKPTAKVAWETLLAKSLQIAREEGVIDHLLIKVPDAMHHGKAMDRSLLATVQFPPDVSLLPIIWQSETPIAQRLDAIEQFGAAGYEIPVTDPAYLGQVRDEQRLAGRPLMAIAVQPQWSGGLDDETSMRDPDAGWGRLVELGANMIMTDRPEALVAYLERQGKRPKKSVHCE